MSACCAYCGAEQDITRDHLIPRSYSQNGSFRSSETNPIVWACRECNSTLNDQLFNTFTARLSYVRACYKKRYRKELDFPEWTATELATMSANFQAVIKEKLKAAREARRRLRYMDEVDVGLREIQLTNNDLAEVELAASEIVTTPVRAARVRDPLLEEEKALRAAAYSQNRKRYNTLRPCRARHTERYSLNGMCVECARSAAQQRKAR